MSLKQYSNYGAPLMFLTSVCGFIFLNPRLRRASSTLVRGTASLSSGPPLKLTPPVARKLPTNTYFGVTSTEMERGPNPMPVPKVRVDEYHWLRDDTRKNEEILSHIRAENDYCAAATKRLEPLQTELYTEMLSHLKETDEEVPHAHGSYLYYSRTEQGLSYKIHCRKPIAGGDEEVILDENALASGHEYTGVAGVDPSPSHSLLAYGVDFTGYETYSMAVKDLRTGQLLADIVEGSDGSMEWGADESTVFYLTMDEEHRPNKVWVHVLGSPQSDDVCIYEENDCKFWIGISKSASGRYLFLDSGSKETSEIRVIDLQGVRGGEQHLAAASCSRILSPRQFGLRYQAEHLQACEGGAGTDSLLLIANTDGAKNFKLVSVDPNQLGDASLWRDVKAYDPSIQLDDVLPFKTHTVIFGRQGGTQQVWIAANADISTWRAIAFSEDCYSVHRSANYVFDASVVRLVYSSFLSPRMVLDVNLTTNERAILKQQEVPGYDSSRYQSRRLFITSRDNRQVPVSLVYRKDVLPGSIPATPLPMLLYGYGSYGACIDPSFDYKRAALLDRGVIYAIAHIRGGGEMGKPWYEDEGKYLTKLNTFNDFADCAQELSRMGLTSSDRLAVVGRSAGGLLIGAVVNMYPHLFKAAVADVPFVDVMNTMSDPSIPLTVTEWEEWGNPHEEKYHDYMASYSPYDNVRAQNYPALLVTAGLNDPRVAYWEPAKWVAKLRDLKTDSNALLLKTDLSSGHFSASDRYKFLKETAFEYSFILDQIGASHGPK